MDIRPNIPAKVKRRVLVEAGHRCAIPTCRYIEVDIHHIVPWSKCKEHSYENLIALCQNCHKLADMGKIDRKSLRMYKANLRYTHDRFSQFEVDMLFETYLWSETKPVQFPPPMILLVRRLLESGLITRVVQSETISPDGMRREPDLLLITDKGREYIDSLGLHDYSTNDADFV